MEDFEKVGNEIIDYINDPLRRVDELITMEPARFVLCGASGSGKTRAIDYANMILPEDQQVAESNDLLFVSDALTASNVFNDRNIYYAESRHIGFNVVRKAIAEQLEKQGEKVFWLGG